MRVKNDVNGNSRFVCHFLSFVNDRDTKEAKRQAQASGGFHIQPLYNIALSKAKKLGGRKFSNKQYGGGIVFQMYESQQEEMSRKIQEIKEQ